MTNLHVASIDRVLTPNDLDIADLVHRALAAVQGAGERRAAASCSRARTSSPRWIPRWSPRAKPSRMVRHFTLSWTPRWRAASTHPGRNRASRSSPPRAEGSGHRGERTDHPQWMPARGLELGGLRPPSRYSRSTQAVKYAGFCTNTDIAKGGPDPRHVLIRESHEVPRARQGQERSRGPSGRHRAHRVRRGADGASRAAPAAGPRRSFSGSRRAPAAAGDTKLRDLGARLGVPLPKLMRSTTLQLRNPAHLG